MGKYRKKPIVIEAFQYTAEACAQIHDWMGVWHGGTPEVCGVYSLFIETLKGPMEAQPGDWIIKGVMGEFYPCKADIFDITYETVTESGGDNG